MQNIYSSKRDNTVIPTEVKINQMIQQLINVDKFGAKSVEAYNLKKGFEVLHVASEYTDSSRRGKPERMDSNSLLLLKSSSRHYPQFILKLVMEGRKGHSRKAKRNGQT